MSLLMDIQDYLRRYGTATQLELAQQLRTTPEMVEMMAETLRAKGKVRFTKTMPACMSGACSGSCCDTPTLLQVNECRYVFTSGSALDPDGDSASTC